MRITKRTVYTLTATRDELEALVVALKANKNTGTASNYRWRLDFYKDRDEFNEDIGQAEMKRIQSVAASAGIECQSRE